jgi:tetratricopeptide (TPR) repeat protein/CHAT domain-containing protein
MIIRMSRRSSSAWLVSFLAAMLVIGSWTATPAAPAEDSAPATPLKPLGPKERNAQLAERDRLDQASKQLRSAGKVPEAIAAATKMLALERQLFGNAHDDVAHSLVFLAECHEQQGEYSLAESCCREMYDIRRKTYGDQSWRTTSARSELDYVRRLATFPADVRQHLAEADRLMDKVSTLGMSGKYAEAIPFAQRAAQLRRAALGEDDRKYAESISWLGSMYQFQQDYAQALPWFDQALKIYQRVSGPEHPDTAGSLGNLASVYIALGKDAQALPLYERAIAINEKALGPDDPDTAVSLSNLAMLFKGQGNYKKALPLLERALAIKEKALGPDNPGLANTLNNVASLYCDQGKYAQALPLYQRALAIREKAFGENHPDTAQSLSNLGSLYQDQGNYAQVLPLAQRVVKIYERAFGVGHPATTTSLQNLAMVYRALGDNAQALPLVQQALAIQEKAWGEGHPETLSSVSALAGIYQAQGKYAQALPLFQRALAIREKTLGAEHPETVASLGDLASLYREQGNYAQALPLLQRALSIREKALGAEHPATAASLGELGTLYKDLGDYPQALLLFQRALAIDEEALRANHPNTGADLNNLALLYQEQGNYAQALPLLQRALAIAENSVGKSHPNAASALGNLAALYHAQGDYAQALSLCQQAIAIKERTLGADHPDTLKGVSNLALLYKDRGDYSQALRLNQRVLAIREKALGLDHSDTAISVDELALLYHATGDDEQALPLYQRALAIREKALGPDHRDTAASLNNLAELYRLQGDNARALPLYERALAINKKALGVVHRDTASNFNNLALLYSSQGAYAQALAFQKQALAINEKIFGPDHPATALSIRNMAGNYQDQGDFAQALSLYQRALAIREKALGAEHPGTAEILTSLAGLYQFHGDHTKALPLHQQALAICRANLDLTANAQSERQQLAMVENMRYELDVLVTLIVDRNGLAEDAYREVLAWKGAVLARQRATRLARQGATPELKQTFDELQAVSTQLATVSLAEPEPKQLASWQAKIATLSQKRERLEGELSGQSAEFRQRQSQRKRGVPEIQHVLSADTVLIDFLIYRHFALGPDGKGKMRPERHVAVFVVHRDQPVVLLDLGPIKPIEAAIDAWLTTYGQVNNSATDPGADLRRMVWEKLQPHLGDAKTILLSPDEAIARFPWAALPGKQPQMYLCEEYALAIIPVPQMLPELVETRSAEQQSGQHTPEPSLLLVGDVNYGAAPGQPVQQLASRAAVGLVRGGKRMTFGPLENTRDEIAAIRDSFEQRYPKSKVTILTQAEVTESAFDGTAPHYRWLHLATHGFFAPPQKKSALEVAPQDGSMSEASRGSRSPVGYDPGLLTGLALAGANTAVHDNEDDGILTATEVAALDLSQVDVAVLSACQTGLGKVAGGEGVLGLQRAFQLSGARTTVTSLWTVSDLGTRVLMQHFYENLWTRRMSKIEALRQAQIEMLKTSPGKLAVGAGRGLELDADRPVTSDGRLPPYYWAAFVLSGDWQ